MKFLNLLFLVVFGLTGTINSGHAQEFNNAQAAFIDNLLKNPGAETGGKDFVAYADAAAVTPVDGTGGSPTVTCQSSASSPLKGKRSFLIAKPASNVQGQGCAITVDLPSGYATQWLNMVYMKFTSANYADGDLRMYAYDVTGGGNPIEFNQRDVMAGSSDYSGGYQVPFGSTQIRLIFHIAATHANSWSVELDDIFHGRKPIVYGPVVTDWTTYTPSWTGSGSNPSLGNGSLIGRYRIIGDSLEYRIELITGGTTTYGSGTYRFSIPSGFTIDTAKVASGTVNPVGTSTMYDVSAGVILHGTNDVENATNIGTRPYNSTTNHSSVTNINPWTWASGDYISLTGQVPIVGLSSNAISSESGGQRRIEGSAYLTGTQTISTTALTKITFNAVTGDTAGIFDTVNNRFTLPESGAYLIGGLVRFGNVTSGEVISVRLRKNGASDVSYSNTVGTSANEDSAPVEYLEVNGVKGDYYEVYADSTADASYDVIATSINSRFYILKLSSPQNVYSAATVAATYQTNAGQSVTNATDTTINYEDLIVDSHSSMNTSTGEYTVPVSGTYGVSASIQYAFSAWDVGESTTLSIMKNGVKKFKGITEFQQTSGNYHMGTKVFGTLPLVKGDVLKISVYQDSGLSKTLNADETYNSVSITRVGN